MTGVEQARALIRATRTELGGDPRVDAELRACEQRLDEPLRVALTGALKSGKSTLLNALVGEEIAPTDATECTRVVTWFSRGAAPRIDLVHDGGVVTSLPVLRAGGRLSLDLGAVTADRVGRLEVRWPSALLERYTLVDTPGTSSNSRDVSERTLAFLEPEDGPCEADVIVYLMRNLHDSDVQFLRRLREHRGAGAGPLGVVGVLSRADETDGGRGASLEAAHRVRGELRAARELDGLHQDFVPVSGLLALRGQTLRQSEFTALRALAGVPEDTLATAMISTSRFTRPESDLPVSAARRAQLLDTFGVFGIRVAVSAIRSGAADASALAAELVRRSGLDELRRSLDIRFGQRNGQLKTHAALRSLRRILLRHRRPGTGRLLRSTDRLLADRHAFVELRVLSGLHVLELPEPIRDTLELVLGGAGTSATQRLGLPRDAPPAQVRDTALRAVRFWRDRLEHPVLDVVTAQAYRAAVRSCEAVLAHTPAAPRAAAWPVPAAPLAAVTPMARSW
ncbi:dynamin family protein [Pseudonocardia acidicola]|uniref:Isoniazid-inducible protein iniC n=1 Tax=Pseudonocardia acidicola TaxID=2724939 RepID=A0ABX1SJD6_9PSEU|nr:dynamin family protein [Pseudonocardia acidicola]NMI01681.1 Isoniazid-inducible protein iniC [Pseudonocardia acidicola]